MSLVSEGADLTQAAAAGVARAEPSLAGVEDYLALLKPRVMSLVVFTALVGLLVAPGHVHPVIGFAALLCIAIGAGASGALNMWYDADIDAVMTRTAQPADPGRPRRSRARRSRFGADARGRLGAGARRCWSNWLAAALLAFTIFFYVVVYTMWLKRSTPQNIVIGGAAGAFPPMIGWAAVTGDVGLEPVLMFLIIFLWTPPHFWALALLRADDYARAGVPMLPVVAGPRRDAPADPALFARARAGRRLRRALLGFAGLAYGAVALVGGARDAGARLARLSRPRRDRPRGAAREELFAFSILYLFVLFAALLADNALARLGLAAMSDDARRTGSCSPRSRSAGAARARSRSRCRSACWWCCSTSSPS